MSENRKYDSVIALPQRLMIQKLRGTTARPARREAPNCTSQRAPNSSAPNSPISFQGVTAMPVQSSAAMVSFMA